ncbi:MAG: hypothetical protein AB7V48_10850 [Sedimentibacter sp.]
MTKKQGNQNNNNENKNVKNQDTYRNDSKLTDRNGYMIYELNNTFEDKDKDVLNINKLENKKEQK